MSPSEQHAPTLDVRLVPSALAAWLTVGTGILAGTLAGVVLAAVAVPAAAVVLARHRHRAGAAGLLAVLAVVTAFGLATALRSHAVSTNPLAGGPGRSTTVEIVLTDDPKALRGAALPGAPPRVLVAADLVSSTDHAHLGGAVVVLAPAQGWAGLLPGQHVRVRGQVAAPQRHDLTVAALRVDRAPEVLGLPSAAQRAAGSLRTGLREAAARTLGPDSAGLLPGLVVGDTSALSDDLVADAKVAGLTHLTAVSGTNITIVLGAVVLLVRGLGAGPRTAAVLAGLALVGFVVLARPSPSVLRAAVMGTVALLALVTGRRRQALPALSGAVLVLLAVRPALAVDAGFALSVLATGALVLLAPRWVLALRRRGVPAGVAELLAVPAAAHVVTAPVIAGLSSQLSLVAVLANLLAAPAVGVATVAGVAAAVVLPVWTPAGEVLVRLAGPPVWWLVEVTHRAADVPGAVVAVPGGAAGAVGMAAATVVALVLARSAAVRGLVVAVVVGAGLVVVPTRLLLPGWPVTGWALVACDVGQGDALVLSAGEGSAVVVDTGPDPSVIDGCLDRLGVTQVPLVVLSHLHADHVRGLAGVLEGRSVGAVAVGPLHLPEDAVAGVQATAAEHGVPVVDLAAGQRLQWPGLTLDVLAPTRTPPTRLGGDPGTQIDEFSLVLAAQTTLGRVLLPGDVELGAQGELLSSGLDLHADVLKVPHHGSRFSLPEFFDAVAPRVAVISAGQGNPYGHPSAPVLEHLAAVGVPVERTDQAGDVALRPGPDGPVVVERGDPRPPP
ncbi:ComEC/Rec2 family competence protein [Rhodococcus antarcticus]|uniref:ComEC/Rec2 family competence protein n=1 Tax=Rhodococcus antarcticus TaxID=2987751 RepID=A0ABY6NWM0_9NOCA|nr:ComEC/Rec2 family competence protein [Rhodococcus antarcticus]UZJ23789.1 ComEC/Rec2 family competence protein [Rhodococcus antarcticus]